MLAWEEVNDRVCGVKQNAGWLGWGGLGDEANRVSISSRCVGWRVPRTSGGWCRTSEAQALMQNLWGAVGNPDTWCLNAVGDFVWFFPLGAEMELCMCEAGALSHILNLSI